MKPPSVDFEDVDRLATLALKSASRRKLKAVDRDIVRGLPRGTEHH